MKFPSLRAEPRGPSDAAAPLVTGNPRPFAPGSDYERLQRYARLVTAYSSASTVAFVLLAGFTASLFPLEKVKTEFVMFSDAKERTFTLGEDGIDVSMRDVITEKLLRTYVVDREMINNLDETERYGFVQRASSRDVFSDFESRMNPNKSTSPLRVFRAAHQTREIHITDVYPNNYADHIYSVEFTAIDRDAKTEVKRDNWIATIQVAYQTIKGKPDFLRENPAAMVVIGYEIRGRDLTAQRAAK